MKSCALHKEFWPDFKFICNPPTADKIGFELGLFFWAGRRFHFHNPFVKKRLRSFWAFEEIGFDWVCFYQMSNWIYFHNSLYYIDLRSFDFFGNWVCFA